MTEEGFYDPIGVTKSRVCCLIAKSKAVREALQYRAIDAQYAEEYDPENYQTLLWNCIIPFLKDPDTITTSDPQILVGIESQRDYDDPRMQTLYGTIVIVVDNTDIRTNYSYLRTDLVETAGVCAYTKADVIAYAVQQALAEQPSHTWIGEIEFIESTEYSINTTNHYGRTIKFKVGEVNLENRGV